MRTLECMHVIVCMQIRSTNLSEKEISQLKETIERLEKEKQDLVNRVEVGRTTVSLV